MTRTEELRQHGARSRTDAPVPTEDAKGLLVATLGGVDPWAKLEELKQAGERRARASGIAYQLEEQRKIVLAKKASDIANLNARENLSEAKLERLARASDAYQDHVNGTAEAIAEEKRTEAEYWRIRADLDWCAKAIAHWNAVSRLEEP